MIRAYATLFMRLVANTRLADPDDANSCWLWTGKTVNGYPKVNVWANGRTISRRAHRCMLEELHQIEFPHDEAGHLCGITMCINPAHLEVQTQAFNLSERRNYRWKDRGRSWIPVLYPRRDLLQEAAERAWETPGEPGQACPF